ncbi:C40 family peptidase [Ottowia caeni]|uniref:C40 family peptidase n=1 Tax=Ottowia caeni TaxID=2870339 RepID=UPI003D716BF0
MISRLSDTIHHATDRASNLVVNAMGALGVPYRFGGTSAETGFDCSGFVRAMVQQTVGMLLPRSSEQQAAATEQIEKAELKPGDLVFFNTRRRAYSHVGIYVGDEKFIHAPRSGARVRVESMESRYWTTRFNGARRVLSDSSGETMQASSSRVITRESPAPRSVRLGGGFSQPAPTAPLPSLPSAGDSI